jgi:hypothetical protein
MTRRREEYKWSKSEGEERKKERKEGRTVGSEGGRKERE